MPCYATVSDDGYNYYLTAIRPPSSRLQLAVGRFFVESRKNTELRFYWRTVHVQKNIVKMYWKISDSTRSVSRFIIGHHIWGLASQYNTIQYNT